MLGACGFLKKLNREVDIAGLGSTSDTESSSTCCDATSPMFTGCDEPSNQLVSLLTSGLASGRDSVEFALLVFAVDLCGDDDREEVQNGRYVDDRFGEERSVVRERECPRTGGGSRGMLVSVMMEVMCVLFPEVRVGQGPPEVYNKLAASTTLCAQRRSQRSPAN